MVVRVVRMHFRPEEIGAFLEIFNTNKEAIRAFPGCTYMELMRDVQSPSVLVTLSHWNSAEDLERYRHSPLFNAVWNKVKKLFSGRPEAFTLGRVDSSQ
jgi:quinol monooxygenase YgiN